jgi:hypothetical protein
MTSYHMSSSSATTTPRISTPPALFPQSKVLELRGFEFFQLRTAQEICQAFDFGFWRSLVLQLSRSEPAVLHAAIALGTLHETEEALGMPAPKDRVSDSRHRFAVSEYNTSIKLLTELANKRDMSSSSSSSSSNKANNSSSSDEERIKVTVLATCLIFVHIDLLRGHHQNAVLHIRSALDILDEDNGVIPSDIKTMMKTAFRRLDIQSVHFDSESPFARPTGNLAPYGSRPFGNAPFQTVAEGKERYDILIYHSFRLLRKCERSVCKHRKHQSDDGTIKYQKYTLIRIHDDFIAHCREVALDPKAMSSAEDRHAILLLQMHALLTRIFISVCPFHDGEADFADHLRSFQQIVILANTYISSLSSSEGRRGSGLPSLSTDWGVILPLASTAMKCRDETVRNVALALLESCKHREGFWDATLAAKICRQVVELENSDGAPGNRDHLVSSLYVDVSDSQEEALLSWEWYGAVNFVPSTRNTISVAI